jgi:hypothetical protein
MGLSGGKDEFYVGRRLFQGLEKCIEGVCGKHVDFIDDEDFETAARREIFDIIPEFTDILDTGVGSSIDLENVCRITRCYLKTCRADIAWLLGWAIFTLERLGKNAGSTGLPDSASARKKKGMGNPAGLDSILQRPADMLLTDQITKCLWPPFSR